MGSTGKRHRMRVFVGIAAAVIALALPATGFAHTLTLVKAKAAAAVQAKKIKSDTEAQSSTVTGCARKTQHKFLCKVTSRYSTGISKCVTDVTIYYSSHASTRPKAAIGRSNCS